jgi:hypothetical protein
MEKKTKYLLIKFSFVLLLFSLFTILFFFKEGNLAVATQLTLLCWSFYILCFPAFHGKITLGIPFQFLTGKILLYPEIYMWSGALLLNLFFSLQAPAIYFKTITTHLLYQIFTTPWPFCLIIIVCGLGTLYKFIVGSQNFYSRRTRHFFLRSLIISVGLFALIYLSYQELIILINVRA